MKNEDLKTFYSNSKRLDYNPRENIPGYKLINKFISFDDRFITIKNEIENLINKSNRKIRMLDIGVGDAVFEKMLYNSSKKIDFYGVDISREQINRSKKYLTDAKIIDLNKILLPYRHEIFDLVLISELLEHVFYPDKILKEAVRVLKKGGYLVLTFPNFSSLQIRLSVLFCGYSPLINYPVNKEHIRFFAYKDILKMVGSTMRLIKYQGLGSFYFTKWNFRFRIITPRLLEIFGNKFLPELALGNYLIFKK